MTAELGLEELTVKLDEAGRKARRRLQVAKRRTLQTFANPSEHKKLLQEFLTEMANVIAEAVSPAAASYDSRLFVWPGYDSILLDNDRITFEVESEARRTLEAYGYQTRVIGDDVPRPMQTGALFPEVEGTDRATLYFDAALGAMPPPDDKKNTFSTGGTHNWLAFNPTTRDGPLLGFHARTVTAPAVEHPSFPVIRLDREDPLAWGDQIAAVLNELCGDTPQSFWPLPIRRSGETIAAYRDRLATEHGAGGHRRLRQRLYSLWLIGCLSPNPADVLLGPRGLLWMEELIKDVRQVEPSRANRLRHLLDLERATRSSRSVSLNDVVFNSWSVVTVPYPIADSRSDDSDDLDELGSGMLLSDFALPPHAYLMLRQWIASYYLSLRQQESAVLRAEGEAHKAAIHAEREIRRQLSHAVGTELTYVSFLATHATSLVTEAKFLARDTVIAAGIRNGRSEQPVDTITFGERFGAPSPLETKLTKIALTSEVNPDAAERTAALIDAVLRQLPTAEAWKIIYALSENVKSVIAENRALVRVDDPTVIGELTRSTGHGTRLVKLLGSALVVALTVYFRKAFPPFGEGGEEVCLKSASALFGTRRMSDEERRETAKRCSIEWSAFLTSTYAKSGERPTYGQVIRWLRDVLGKHSCLFFDLPRENDDGVVTSSGGENAPIIIEAWLTEALLNILKHSRPSPSGEAVVVIDWVQPGAYLTVSNTTSAEKATVATGAADAYARGSSSIIEGHQGLAFLGYAAKHLFEKRKLTTSFDHATHVLRIAVN